jgi:hypothetical protein
MQRQSILIVPRLVMEKSIHHDLQCDWCAIHAEWKEACEAGNHLAVWDEEDGVIIVRVKSEDIAPIMLEKPTAHSAQLYTCH